MTANRYCDRHLPNTEWAKNPCGTPINQPIAARCKLHVSNLVTDIGAVYDFIRHRAEKFPGEVLFFGKFNFKGLYFEENDDLGRGCPILFDSCNFDDCRFQSVFILNCKFVGCTFQGVSFDNCKLKNAEFRSHFSGTTFSFCDFIGNVVRFSQSTFDNVSVPFSACNFHLDHTPNGELGVVEFVRSSITAQQDAFSLCRVIAPEMDFSFCTIDAPRLRVVLAEDEYMVSGWRSVTLIGVSRLSMRELGFTGALIIHQGPDCQDKAFGLNFQSTMFDHMRAARLTDVNLTQAIFWRSELESVNFINCRWNEKDGYVMVHDEALCADFDAVSFGKELVRLYTQLKKNYEDRRNYIDAGQWFYREMEARRRVKLLSMPPTKWRRVRSRFCSLSLWYKIISKYGESHVRPMWWIIGVLVGSAILHMFTGFQIGNETIQFTLGWPGSPMPTVVIGFLKAVICSLSVMTLQFGKLVSPINSWGIALASVQGLLTLVLVPLFLLAVRRKFRR